MTGTLWQNYTALTGAPAPADTLLLLQKLDESANAAGTVHQVTTAALFGKVGYVFPSGDDTGATDVAAINAIIGAGGTCVLAWTGTDFSGGQTPYYINAPLTPTTGSSLVGAAPAMASNADNYGAGAGGSSGSVIYIVTGFSGAAAINMTNTTGTQFYGVTLADFSLEMYQMPAGHGILVDGAWGACVMSGVNCNGAFADNLHFQTDATSGFCADDWRVYGCKFNGALGYGVWGDNVPDSWFTDCESSENKLDNWWLGFSLNTRLNHCKGENSATGTGFHLTGQGGAGRFVTLTGCSTHLNNQDGFLFDGSSSGSSGGDYMLANCVAIDDGQAGGTTYGGFRSNGSVNRIIGSNCKASGAAYGAAQESTSAGMDFDHSTFSGTSKNLSDDGSNATPLVSRNSPDQQRVTLGTAFNSGTGTSAQTVTGMAVTLAAGTYNITAYIPMAPHGTTGSTQKLAFTFSGTASSGSASWTIAGTTSTGGGGASITAASAVSATMTSAGLLGTFTGKVVVTASGTLQLTVTSGTSGDEVTIPVGSWINAELVVI